MNIYKCMKNNKFALHVTSDKNYLPPESEKGPTEFFPPETQLLKTMVFSKRSLNAKASE